MLATISLCNLVWASLCLLIQLSTAQSSVTPASTAGDGAITSASSRKPAQTHTVNVGKLNHQYDPDIIQAAVNDVIEFQFFPPNHSVARAEYQYPCIPYELTGPNKIGFSSGFYAVDAVLDAPPTWNLTVNDTEPIFFYCAAPGSCLDHAMVGVINPNSSVSLKQQKQDARNAAYMVAPGGKLPTGETLPSQTASPTNPATVTVVPSVSPSATATTAATTTQSSTPAPSHHRLSGGAIAGIVVGAVVGVAAIGYLLFLLGRHRTEIQFLRRDAQRNQQRPSGPEMRASYNSVGPSSPGFMHDSEDPRFHEQQKYNYDVPPYESEARDRPAELPSPPLGASISRAGSPSSELDTRRSTMNPSLMENAGLGVMPNGTGDRPGQRY